MGTRDTLDRVAEFGRCPSGGTSALSDGAKGYLSDPGQPGQKKPYGFAAPVS
jgi:hypothetical protein